MNNDPLVIASDLIGRPVVSISSGDQLAELKDIVFDPASHRLVGFTLNKPGWFRGKLKATLPAGEIEAIGPAAVMVSCDDDLVDRSDSPEVLAAPSEAISIIGANVLSKDGEALGTIDDVVVEAGPRPRAVGYRLAGEHGEVFIPISAQMALSEDNLILPVEAAGFVRDDLAGFGAAVESYRSDLDAASSRTEKNEVLS